MERMTDEEMDRLEAVAKAATDGPWRWEINLKSKRLILAGGRPKFDLAVMSFARWGTGGAIAQFLTHVEWGMGLITKATEFVKPVEGRKHHADWFQTLDHPDTNHISAFSPDTALRILAELRDARKANDWITDETKLPERDTIVLVSLQIYGTTLGKVVSRNGEWRGLDGTPFIYPVLGWRSLPKMPSEATGEGGSNGTTDSRRSGPA